MKYLGNIFKLKFNERNNFYPKKFNSNTEKELIDETELSKIVDKCQIEESLYIIDNNNEIFYISKKYIFIWCVDRYEQSHYYYLFLLYCY